MLYACDAIIIYYIDYFFRYLTLVITYACDAYASFISLINSIAEVIPTKSGEE